MRILAALLAVSSLIVTGLKLSDQPGSQTATFATTFLDQLDPEQRSTAVIDFDSDQRVDWHFIPKKTRKGLVLREMDRPQRVAGLRLLRAALSEAGYRKASRIMLLEGVLRELEGEKRNWERDPHKYFITIFGSPGSESPWGLSFEGHHLSLNFSFRDGKLVDSTPQFFAANPATVKDDVSGPLGKGTRVLRAEEQLGFDLVNALEEEQKSTAVIAEKAPKEIRFAGEAQSSVGDPEGIRFGDLPPEQQKMLRKLVHTYTNTVADKVAASRRAMIKKDGWDDVRFAWAGATEPGIGHYYRIRGKRFLIEFVNTQADAAGNPANHIHCVYRDLTGDFDLAIE